MLLLLLVRTAVTADPLLLLLTDPAVLDVVLGLRKSVNVIMFPFDL